MNRSKCRFPIWFFAVVWFFLAGQVPLRAAQLLLPMDGAQSDHLKAYGMAYWVLEHGGRISWLLNYRGGSFLLPYSPEIEQECMVRNVSCQYMSDEQVGVLRAQISPASVNMDEVPLEKAPKIAVYSPKSKMPWDDAVTLVLTYAEIPYEVVYDDEVLTGRLPEYDWLHLHHEDFTGQFGKFWASYRHQEWYKEDVRQQQETAARYGYEKVSQLKLAVALQIRDFVLGGGFLFAMCSAPDSYDVALAAEGVDICESPFDGDPMDPQAQEKLDYSKTFAFRDFKIVTDPYAYEISDIDVTLRRPKTLNEKNDYFSLFDFSAKWDWVPTMLCQNHERVIRGFMGQSTAFAKEYLKPSVVLLGQNESIGEARYIHGTYGKGTWTFLGGHDPEDYQHFVGDPKTELELYPHSPGYRLILNNILFPAAKKEPRKT